MLKRTIILGALCYLVGAEAPIQSTKPTNAIGNSGQHAFFSFVRPGLTQTSFAFSGPSSHQSFSANIGDPQLAQRVLPSLAHALAYRNPNLGYYPAGSIMSGYGVDPSSMTSATGPLVYQAVVDPAAATMYMQQLQQQQQQQTYQAQLAQLLALRQAQGQVQPEQLQTAQFQQQQEEQPVRQSSNLLGVAYSPAPSVAHVKVSGNGYKFNF